MTGYIFEAIGNIQPKPPQPSGYNYSSEKIPQRESGIIHIGSTTANERNLFNDSNSRNALISQLNITFGVSFFNKDNIQSYATSFRIKKI